ncbi:MAG TPA: DUF2442 domain-containing protein [Thermoanaerobaculia bacterium]|nr:DUF2442 domain-containing protein [Thermoanaerobaculia bacterium]
MFYDIRTAEPLANHRLRLAFDDGVEGIVDLGAMLRWEGVFESLRDEREFEKVRVNTEAGIVEWPNGADLDSIVLYANITRRSIEDVLKATVAR